MSGVRVSWGPECAVSEVWCMSPRSNVVQAGCPARDRGPRLCIEPLRRDTRMTLGDWVARAMLWWKGGGRPAIVRWLVEPRRAGRMGAGCRATFETVVSAIDPGLAASGRLARARAAAQGALEAAHAGGITAVPWSDTRYPTALAAIADPPPGPVDPRRSGGAQDTHGCDCWLPRRLRVCPRCGSGAGIGIGAMRRHSGQRTGPGRRLGRASRCAGCRRSHGWCAGLWCGHHVPSRAQWAGA